MVETKIIAVVGKSNSGKTTLLEKLIACLTQRGYRVGSVKHAHDGFEMDKKGKDSWRHRQAGAGATLVITNDKVALIKDDAASDMDKMRSYLSGMDLVLAEGFKRQHLPKIEIFRTQSVHKNPLCTDDEDLIAFVTDSDHKPNVPVFGLDAVGELADFIESNFLKCGFCAHETV